MFHTFPQYSNTTRTFYALGTLWHRPLSQLHMGPLQPMPAPPNATPPTTVREYVMHSSAFIPLSMSSISQTPFSSLPAQKTPIHPLGLTCLPLNSIKWLPCLYFFSTYSVCLILLITPYYFQPCNISSPLNYMLLKGIFQIIIDRADLEDSIRAC